MAEQEERAEERAKLQDRIEELEKNLSYEVEQKIKLADTLRDERAKRPDLPCDGGCNVNDGPMEECSLHGRTPRDLWGIIEDLIQRLATERAKRPDREHLAQMIAKHRIWSMSKQRVICACGWRGRLDVHELHAADAVLALEPEAREGKLERLAAVTNINLITKAMLEEVGYPSHFHPADAPSWAYSVLEEEHEERTAPEAREVVCADEHPHGPHAWPHVPSYECPGVAREEPLIECPHWEPGRLTKRKGCTACAAEAHE